MQDLEEANGAVAPEGGVGETKAVVAPVAVKYEEYIHSLRWEMKRQEAFRHWGRVCPVCGKASGVMDIHHLSYSRLGKEEMDDLLPVCRWHHKVIHECGIETEIRNSKREEIPAIVKAAEEAFLATNRGQSEAGRQKMQDNQRIACKRGVIEHAKRVAEAQKRAEEKIRNRKREERRKRKQAKKEVVYRRAHPEKFLSKDEMNRRIQQQKYLKPAEGPFSPSIHY